MDDTGTVGRGADSYRPVGRLIRCQSEMLALVRLADERLGEGISRRWRGAARLRSPLPFRRTKSCRTAPVRTNPLLSLREPPVLTEREAQVLELVAAGLSSREAAGRLFVSAKDIDFHMEHLAQKLECSKRTASEPRIRTRLSLAAGVAARSGQATGGRERGS